MKAAFFCNNEEQIAGVYGKGRRERIESLCEVYPEIISSDTIDKKLPDLKDLDVIFSTWGAFPLTESQLDQMPRLKAFFYAAGSVKGFAGPLIGRGIKVVSGWAANAIPVAEFTLAQIILANKGYFRNFRDCSSFESRQTAFRGAGNFEETVSILGAGMIGRKVIELLKPFRLKIIVYDPFLSEVKAKELGVEKVSLAEAFGKSIVVSSHIPDLPETRGMLRKEHFERMLPAAVFINTARGATVVEEDLIEVLEKRPDLMALLDVTFPEPPLPCSKFYRLPNVLMSSHIAGSIGNEILRMADTVTDEFDNWRKGGDLKYSISLEMLETMA